MTVKELPLVFIIYKHTIHIPAYNAYNIKIMVMLYSN